jgi:hypothetical protein
MVLRRIRSIAVKTRYSLFAAAALVLGLSAIGHAEAANSDYRSTSMQAQGIAAPGDRADSRYVARSDSDPNGTTNVTVRPYGSHNDGYRTSQGWWKDD